MSMVWTKTPSFVDLSSDETASYVVRELTERDSVYDANPTPNMIPVRDRCALTLYGNIVYINS